MPRPTCFKPGRFRTPIKNIHLGPTLPAFLSPDVAQVLIDNFGIGGITNVEEDMALFLGA